ncbi:MAG: hypothetical protein OEO83_02660 [Alphaproteobacteria bacterium]|nr:hypothetical protein [Alphaproteobacteria bacterium]
MDVVFNPYFAGHLRQHRPWASQGIHVAAPKLQKGQAEIGEEVDIDILALGEHEEADIRSGFGQASANPLARGGVFRDGAVRHLKTGAEKNGARDFRPGVDHRRPSPRKKATEITFQTNLRKIRGHICPLYQRSPESGLVISVNVNFWLPVAYRGT